MIIVRRNSQVRFENQGSGNIHKSTQMSKRIPQMCRARRRELTEVESRAGPLQRLHPRRSSPGDREVNPGGPQGHQQLLQARDGLFARRGSSGPVKTSAVLPRRRSGRPQGTCATRLIASSPATHSTTPWIFVRPSRNTGRRWRCWARTKTASSDLWGSRPIRTSRRCPATHLEVGEREGRSRNASRRAG